MSLASALPANHHACARLMPRAKLLRGILPKANQKPQKENKEIKDFFCEGEALKEN